MILTHHNYSFGFGGVGGRVTGRGEGRVDGDGREGGGAKGTVCATSETFSDTSTKFAGTGTGTVTVGFAGLGSVELSNALIIVFNCNGLPVSTALALGLN